MESKNKKFIQWKFNLVLNDNEIMFKMFLSFSSSQGTRQMFSEEMHLK